MSYRRRSPLLRLLPWLLALVALVYGGFRWGNDILRFVTGQDILEELAADIASQPRPTAEAAEPEADLMLATGEPASAPLDLEAALAPDGFPMKPRPAVLRYTVQSGDALLLIAQKFDLSPNTIFWANTETLQDNIHLIQTGVELYILPTDGVYHLSDGIMTVADIAAQYGVTAGDILYSEYNQLDEYDSSYVPPAGQRIVVPGGQRQYVTWQSPIRTGTEGGGSSPEASYHPGACRQTYNGSGGLQQWINPLGSTPYRVTQTFAPWHPGIDEAADPDTPIYAAETGVVVFAGWHRDGYGELIVIDHGDGWTTYYGHLATRFVGCGDQVSKGQYIGQMGMSGNASGIHLHFEMRENDIPQDPRRYLDIVDMRTGG